MNDMENAEAELLQIRKLRYDYITVNEKLDVVVTNQIAFSENIAQEAKIMKDLQQLIQLFNLLNPLFERIIIDCPRLSEPTITGLKRLKSAYKHNSASIMNRIKSEAANRLTNRGFGAGLNSMQEILNSADFKKWAETQENQIQANEILIGKIDSYINDINNIFIGIFGSD
jgi:hypothetical protein